MCQKDYSPKLKQPKPIMDLNPAPGVGLQLLTKHKCMSIRKKYMQFPLELQRFELVEQIIITLKHL